MREIDSLAMEAKTNSLHRENLIKNYELYILKCASTATHRYITKHDDEWSISLLAFSQAIDDYDLNKGNFLGFAELVIKRRLIDYRKGQKRYDTEISVDPILFDTEPEEDTQDLNIRMAIADQVSKQDKGDIKVEIQAVTATLNSYGFSFLDLASCSPHADKTKKACAKAVNYILQHSLLLEEIRSSKQLPMKTIEKNTQIPRKILDRHRKYIIAAIEILSGGYPNLAEYMRFIREENEQ